MQLVTSGVMQLGWCTQSTQFRLSDGVGDDPTSYAFDGERRCKWNQQKTPWGENWVMGDVIGTMLDLESGEISFWRNHKFMGIAFKNVPMGPNLAYFPAISMSRGERVIFNFGLRPFLNQSLPF